MLLGKETSGNHQAYRRGHLDTTILNEIRAAKECGRNLLRNYFNKNSSTFFKSRKAWEIGNRSRKTVPDPGSLVKNCNFFNIRATGMHAKITGCSCVISMDLTVCHKQIK